MLGCLGFLDAFFVFPSVIDCFWLFKVVLGCFKLFLVVQVLFGRFGVSGCMGLCCFMFFLCSHLLDCSQKFHVVFLVVRVVVGFLGDLRCFTLFQVVKIVFTLFEELRVV